MKLEISYILAGMMIAFIISATIQMNSIERKIDKANHILIKLCANEGYKAGLSLSESQKLCEKEGEYDKN